MAEKTTSKQPAAEKTAVKQQPQGPPQKKKRGLFKILLVVLLLVILAGGGFAVGVYLNLIDGPKLAEQHKLSEYPVIGKYFQKPKTNFEPVELETATTAPGEPIPPVPLDQAQKPLTAVSSAQVPIPAPVVPPLTEAEKQKLKQEEAKRISKAARLYGGMKPEEAVPILNQLDDATVLAIFSKMEEDQVAKLLGQLDPRRAARLTDSMLKGNKPTNSL